MEKMKTKVSILLTFCLIITGMVLAMPKVSAASNPADAPVNWAFEPSSVELNDAIVAAYPGIDAENGDGFITINDAAAMTGTLNLGSKGITGTINGIENFTNIDQLILNNNQIEGSIPSNIGYLTSLTKLRLQGNQLQGSIPTSIVNLTNLDELLLHVNKLEGNIPTSIGNLNNLITLRMDSNSLDGSIPSSIGGLVNLNELSLHNNNLDGNIPSSIGSLSSLARLNLRDNMLTGEIPSSIGGLINLTHFNIQNNNIGGTLTASIYVLPLLEKLELHNNSGLTGNPATGFASSTTLNYLDIRGTGLIQASPEIPTLGYTVGTFLYDNLAENLLDGSKTTLADGVTQATIDSAQDSADFITDPAEKQQWQDDIDLAQKMLDAKNTVDGLLNSAGDNLAPGITENDIDDAQDLVTALPDGALKDELQAKIDTARNMLDAKAKTEGLLTTDGANLKPGVDKGKIDEAQEAVNKLPNGELKSELQSKIDTAKNLLDAEKKVGGLIGPDGKLKPGVDKGKIDEAQAAVNKLPNGETKDRLQAIIDIAYNLLNTKDGNGNGNGKTTVVSKPSTVGGSKMVAGSVTTGDNTNLMPIIILLSASLLLIGLIINRKRFMSGK